ncbi:MAG TPA: cupredoxin family copper-binding protein [Amycolatopsis sp.]|nr:cupredoxin family copper-binding protein [Amycolatopsis sp.]
MPDPAVLPLTSTYLPRRARLAVVLAVPFLTFAASPAEAATQVVMMQGYAFSPASLTVHTGDTVTWMQHDEAPHDATTTSAPAAFRSPQLSQGQSWSYTFQQAGTYSYYCSVHPDMRASVTVLAAATTAPAKPAAPSKPVAAAAPKPAAKPERTTATTAPASTPAPATATATTQPAITAAAPAAQPSLDPMLLVAGLVTGIAVLCLLLLSSRPS